MAWSAAVWHGRPYLATVCVGLHLELVQVFWYKSVGIGVITLSLLPYCGRKLSRRVMKLVVK